MRSERMKSPLQLFLLCAVAACTLAACATESEIVDFSYVASVPSVNATPSAVPVEIRAMDLRRIQDRFSSKTDAYGYEHAPISSTQSVPAIVEGALADELKARGFRVGTGGVHLDVSILAFYTRFTDHHEDPFKQDTADAVVALAVVVKRNGRAIYSREVSGGNSERAPTQLHWGGTAAHSQGEALRQALTRLLDDPAFRRVVAGIEAT